MTLPDRVVFSVLDVVGGSTLFGSASFCCTDAGMFDVGDADRSDAGFPRL